MDQTGILVLADAHYPGWNVSVDGSQQEVLEVNSVYRGVFLPAGTHTVSFQFRPAPLYWGLGLAAFGVLLATLLIIYVRRKSSPAASPQSQEEWLNARALRW
jgi:uncharacterized membrane protein YfhO